MDHMPASCRYLIGREWDIKREAGTEEAGGGWKTSKPNYD